MKNFYQYLAPFAPDYSGAAAVLYDTGALTVICDPGGCSGNVCGYDEPRFYENGGAIYSAALRDMDTILGQDRKLAEKIVSAASFGNFELIALVGTPVVSVIATDLTALCRTVESRTGIPTISVETTGLDYYDIGEKKAREALEKRFPGKYPVKATPLDSMPGKKRLDRICEDLRKAFMGKELREQRLLIVHQPAAAGLLAEQLREEGFQHITLGSFFRDSGLGGSPDYLFFDDEELFREACLSFDAVIADPMYFRALTDFTGHTAAFPHLAVSGDLFME